jgi:hypothetical protein
MGISGYHSLLYNIIYLDPTVKPTDRARHVPYPAPRALQRAQPTKPCATQTEPHVPDLAVLPPRASTPALVIVENGRHNLENDLAIL